MELDWNQKNVLVIGAGISGFAAAKLARRFGASVTLSDAKTEEELTKLGDDFAKLRELGIALAFGPQQESLLEGVDTVIVSPAVPVRIPLIQAAYENLEGADFWDSRPVSLGIDAGGLRVRRRLKALLAREAETP